MLCLLAMVAALEAGCGSSQPKYYTLSSWPGTPQGGGPLAVEVRAPVVADYLNRDSIVLNNKDNQLHLAENAAWAEPLTSAIGRNLVLDLSQRLPGSSVFAVENEVAAPEAVVDVTVYRFAEDDAGHAEIAAMVSVHRPDGPVSGNRQIHVVAPQKETSIGALAASLSQLLGQVADQTAEDLRALGPLHPAAGSARRRS